MVYENDSRTPGKKKLNRPGMKRVLNLFQLNWGAIEQIIFSISALKTWLREISVLTEKGLAPIHTPLFKATQVDGTVLT